MSSILAIIVVIFIAYEGTIFIVDNYNTFVYTLSGVIFYGSIGLFIIFLITLAISIKVYIRERG